MKKSRRINQRTILATIVAIGVGSVVLAGCASDADKTEDNLKKAAENFEVQRTIVGINGITGETIFFAEGRCSFEYPASRRVDVICKNGPDDKRRHTFILGDQDSVVVTQENPIDASEYHTRIILKPQNVLPDFDIKVGGD